MVARSEFDDLRAKVKLLEDLIVRVSDILGTEGYVGIWGIRHGEIPITKKVQMLMKHLDLTITQPDCTPRLTKMHKAKKRKVTSYELE